MGDLIQEHCVCNTDAAFKGVFHQPLTGTRDLQEKILSQICRGNESITEHDS